MSSANMSGQSDCPGREEKETPEGLARAWMILEEALIVWIPLAIFYFGSNNAAGSASDVVHHIKFVIFM